jgi:hypothetical protein
VFRLFDVNGFAIIGSSEGDWSRWPIVTLLVLCNSNFNLESMPNTISKPSVTKAFYCYMNQVLIIKTAEPWQCTTYTFESFFGVPKPTGKLLDAILDYGDVLQKIC